jgi:phosphohistidine phosphatase
LIAKGARGFDANALDAICTLRCYPPAMLQLLLLRHSKAAPYTRTGDHERALIERGRDDAARLGAHLAAQGLTLAEAVHSGAKRARETLEIVLGKSKLSPPVAVDPRLYEGTCERFLEVVRARPGGAAPLLLVGHNPSVAEAAHRLVGTGDGVALLQLAAKFPTSGLAIIDFDRDHWADVADGAGRLVDFVTPAALGGHDD